jgi:putative hydrolase of the HAD superfamily
VVDSAPNSTNATANAVDAVLLDLGGVFYLPDHERMRVALARLGIDADPDDLDRAHYLGVAGIEGHLAAIPDDTHDGHRVWYAYNRSYAEAVGVADDRFEHAMAILLEEFGRGGVWTREIPGARDALRAIAATGVKVAIVSNADGTVEQQLLDDGICQVGPGRGVKVDAVLDSTVVGVAKPDPAIFHLALTRLGVEPDRAIHVGDMPAADVAGARAAGVRPVLVDPYGHHGHLDCDRVASLAEVPALLGA